MKQILKLVLTAVTPLLEKNPVKVAATSTVDVPVVFSMARLIVLAFAVAMVRQLWIAGVAGWPDATVSIGVVLAMPMLSAMERAAPDQVIDLAKTLVARFGVGAARQGGSSNSAEPSTGDASHDEIG